MAHHKAIYPGSFDPPTLGHLDVLTRARRLFDEIVLAVGRNPDKGGPFIPIETRLALLQDLVDEIVAKYAGREATLFESLERLEIQ